MCCLSLVDVVVGIDCSSSVEGLLARLQKETEEKQFMVDRRVVNDMLTGYVESHVMVRQTDGASIHPSQRTPTDIHTYCPSLLRVPAMCVCVSLRASTTGSVSCCH